jgi:hypothetical protein
LFPTNTTLTDDAVASFADVFRVGPSFGTNLPVYATLTNHTAQIAGKQPSGNYATNSPEGIAAAGGATKVLLQGTNYPATAGTITLPDYPAPGTGGGTVTNLDDLADVDAAAPSVDDVLGWDGTNWTARADAQGAGAGGNWWTNPPTTAVLIGTNNPTAGQVLTAANPTNLYWATPAATASTGTTMIVLQASLAADMTGLADNTVYGITNYNEEYDEYAAFNPTSGVWAVPADVAGKRAVVICNLYVDDANKPVKTWLQWSTNSGAAWSSLYANGISYDPTAGRQVAVSLVCTLTKVVNSMWWRMAGYCEDFGTDTKFISADRGTQLTIMVDK